MQISCLFEVDAPGLMLALSWTRDCRVLMTGEPQLLTTDEFRPPALIPELVFKKPTPPYGYNLGFNRKLTLMVIT